MSDLAAAITQSLSKDGQTVPTADLPMGGFKHTGVGDPVLRNNYASLGWIQDGRDKRLTNVVGVNQIDAILPGGAVTAVVGQIVQLIPTSNNTGAVTLNINSTGYVPVLTDIGNSLGGGNLIAGRTYLLSYTGAAWLIISASGGVAGFAQSAMSGWDRPSISGPYPAISLVNPTTVFVPAGAGRIVRPSARDLSGVTEVSWPGQNVTITNVAVAWMTTLGVNAAGAIVQFTGTFNPAWARENILIGSVAHINGQINEINTIPAIYGDMTYAAYDTALLLNNTLVSGGKVLPNAASPFHIDLQAGLIFSLGADSADVNGPNTGNFPAAFDLSFFPVTGNNTVGASTQNVPVTQYDPLGAGAVTPIPGPVSTTTIHRLYLLAGEAVFLYGQNTYADLTTALSQIGVDDASTVIPSKLVNATLLAYIVAQKDCVDLKVTTKARIVAKGSTNFNIGTAGSIAEAPINGLTYGRKDATWVEAVPAPVGAQATLRLITYYTNTFARFAHGLNDTPEGGSNTGSNWELRRYNDAGTLLGTVMTVNRSTGDTDFNGNVAIPQDIKLYLNAPTDTRYLSYDSAGSKYVLPGAPLEVNGGFVASQGTAVAFTSVQTDLVKSNTGNLELATNGFANIVLHPRGPGVTTAEIDINASGDLSVRGLAAGTLNVRGAAANAANLILLNVTTGELGRIQGSLNTLTFQTGAAPVTRLTLNNVNATFTLPVIAAQDFSSSTATVNLGTTGAGTIRLRPNGVASAVGETTIASTGDTIVNGSTNAVFTLQANGGFANLALAGSAGNPAIIQLRNGTTGELARLGSAADTFTIATGTTAVVRATFTSAGVTLTVPIVSGGSVTSTQDFVSSTTTAILATTGAGSIALRPNGAGSAAGQFSLAATGNATFFGPTSVIVKAQGQGGFGAHESNSSGANDAYHFFSNATTGELVRLVGSANTFAIQTGSTPVQRAAFTNNGITFNQNLVMTPAVLTNNPISISGAFTGGGRLITFTNTDVSTGSLAGVTLKSGSSVGTTFADYATEYTGVSQFTAKFGLENSNAAGGIAYSALGATGTHTWYQGAARTQMMQLTSAGLSLATATGIGFYGTAIQTKKTVSGSKGANAALTSLLTALAGYGLITDSTT